MLVCATGWELDLDCLPETRAKQSFDTVQSRLFCRFWDIDYPGLAFVSLSNGFMCATENANLVSQAVGQVLLGKWTEPSRDYMVLNLLGTALITVGEYPEGGEDGHLCTWKGDDRFRASRIQRIESWMGLSMNSLVDIFKT